MQDKLAANPERERLFREMVGKQEGLKLTDQMVERFLATVPEDLTKDQADALIGRIAPAAGATEEEIFKSIEKAVADVRAAPGAAGEEKAPPPQAPGSTPAEMQPPPQADPAAQAPPQPAAPAVGQAPAAPKPAAPKGPTPDFLAGLKKFLAGNPTPGLVNPLPEPKNCIVGGVFSRWVAMRDGDSLAAGYMTMTITQVRSVNDFDVLLSPTTFYRADGTRRGVWPSTPTRSTMTGTSSK